MALTILLADDSMTAQNMGKKILTEAGYTVVAVSNGAAAVKKIAEHKPDLAVLDVYMPGYTGLEVCERVKNANATSKMPVLLTVGKMEPFKAEEGTRVRADGVIIKPFEASDLLAAIQKIEEKLNPAKAEVVATPHDADDLPPEYERTVKIAAPVFDEQDQSYKDWRAQAEEHVDEGATRSGTEAIDVPAAMQAAPAFAAELETPAAPTPAPEVEGAADERKQSGVKELFSKAKGWFGGAAVEVPEGPASEAHESAEALESVEPVAEAAEAVETAAFGSSASAETIEHFEKMQSYGASAQPVPEMPVSPAEDTVPIGTMDASDLEVSPRATAPLERSTVVDSAAAESLLDPIAAAPAKVPTEETPAPTLAPEPALESFAPAHEEIMPAEGFEPTSPPSTFSAEAGGGSDPNLVTDVSQMSAEFPTRFGIEGAEPVHVGVASEFPGLYGDERAQAAPATAESQAAPAWQAEEANLEEHEQGVVLHDEMQKQFAASAPGVHEDEAPAPHVEETVVSAPESGFNPHPTGNVPDHELAAAMAAAVGAQLAPAVAEAAAQIPAGDVAPRIDEHAALVAEIVHRVTERMKSTLVLEITKELSEELKKRG